MIIIVFIVGKWLFNRMCKLITIIITIIIYIYIYYHSLTFLINFSKINKFIYSNIYYYNFFSSISVLLMG